MEWARRKFLNQVFGFRAVGALVRGPPKPIVELKEELINNKTLNTRWS